MSKVEDFRISGTLSAPLTPFKENGDLNTGILDQYVDFLVKEKFTGVYLFGTNGEGMSLTVEERKTAGEAWVKACKDKLKYVMVQVGTENLRSSQELVSIAEEILALSQNDGLFRNSAVPSVARHAQQIGATAITSFGPSYMKPPSVDSLVAYMKAVAASAPDLPFYLYDINFMTGIYLKSSEFLEKADGCIPTLRGLKFSSKELPDMLDCKLACGGKFQVLVGSDEQLLTTISLGLDSPVVNGFMGSLVDRLFTAFRNGDMETARKEQNLARALSKIREKYGLIQPGKEIMRLLGIDCGPARLPLLPLNQEQKANLKTELEAVKFL